MIKLLGINDRQLILDFCKGREKECIFITQNLENENVFKNIVIIGYFENKDKSNIKGIARYSKRWESLIVNSQDKEIIYALVDYFIKKQIKIESLIATYFKYGLPIIERFKYHGINANEITEVMFLILEEKNFIDYSDGNEKPASIEDVNDMVILQRTLEHKDINKPISENERERMSSGNSFIIKKEGRVISKIGFLISGDYIQIVGVVTHIDFRKQGYGSKVVSALCKYYFNKGIRYFILSTSKTNIEAQNLYKKIGFKKDGEGIKAEFSY